MQRNLPASLRSATRQAKSVTRPGAARQLARLLGSALDRKRYFESLHIRIDWDRSVFLIHPDLKTRLEHRAAQPDSAVTRQGETMFLFGVRLVADDAQFENAPPELLVVPSPTRERKTNW